MVGNTYIPQKPKLKLKPARYVPSVEETIMNIFFKIVQSSSSVKSNGYSYPYVKQALVARKTIEGMPMSMRIESNSKQKVLAGPLEAPANSKQGKRHEDEVYLLGKLATIERCMSPKSMRTIKRRFKAEFMMDVFENLDALGAFEGKTK